MLWQIEKGIRCDMVCYAAVNLTGKRTQIRIFPGGNHSGDVPAGQLRSMVIRAPYGIRVILVGDPGPRWEASPWRCIRLLEDHALRSEGHGMPGVRIPNIALLDKHGAKKTDDFMETSYPLVERFADGVDWTFGRPGDLRVQLIRVERDRAAADLALPAPDSLARRVYTRAQARDPASAGPLANDIAAALHEALVGAGDPDVATRVRAFQEWVSDS